MKSNTARKVFLAIFAAIFFTLLVSALSQAQEKKPAETKAVETKSESTPAPPDFLALVAAINDTQRSLSETEGVLKFLHAKLDEQIATKLLLQQRLDEQIPAARAKVPPNTNFNPATGKFDPVPQAPSGVAQPPSAVTPAQK